MADRIWIEEREEGNLESTSKSPTNTNLSLNEPLQLELPLLLPEDSYVSENPIYLNPSLTDLTCGRNDLDSGFSSQPNSTIDHDIQTSTIVEKDRGPVIQVESIKQFLNPAIKKGWCRLSTKLFLRNQLKLNVVKNNQDGSTIILYYQARWNVYLMDTKLKKDLKVGVHEFTDQNRNRTEPMEGGDRMDYDQSILSLSGDNKQEV